MKVSSENVFQRKLESLEIRIPENPKDHARAKRELILVATVSFGRINVTEEDITSIGNYFVIKGSESIVGTGFNQLVYGEVTPVDDLLDDEGYNVAR